MVVVMVGEEEVVDLSRPEPGFNEFVRRGWAAVEHEMFVIDFEDERCAESGRRRMWCSCAKDVEFGGHGRWACDWLEFELHQLFCVEGLAVVNLADVADAFF